MHSDHVQPGWTVSRATVASPRWTTLMLVFSGVRDSSGRSMLLVSIVGMAVVLPRLLRRRHGVRTPPQRRCERGEGSSWPARRSMSSRGPRRWIESDVEAELHHVAVAHHVVL